MIARQGASRKKTVSTASPRLMPKRGVPEDGVAKEALAPSAGIAAPV
jgi:hypothetical protein